jgi:hypothetical protein
MSMLAPVSTSPCAFGILSQNFPSTVFGDPSATKTPITANDLSAAWWTRCISSGKDFPSSVCSLGVWK